ncbi:hypothetical protein SUGI_0079030 [Cryptomeria japonica]|nr:hypothetical protein SUGI_0079030 [Cryptomeria japonica]
MFEACIKLISKTCKTDHNVKNRVGKYELVRTIGQGAFAKVKLARNMETGKLVAIKVIEKAKVVNGRKADQIKREISIMKLVKHPNVVELYEVMASKSRIYLVMEYLQGGDLSELIAYQTKLEEEEARAYFHQLVLGLDFCQSRGVCHRDLKPQNLLLDGHGNLKIADFGLSALPDQARQDGLLHTACGTPTYAAPELISNRGYDGTKADLWSCGVILFFLLAGYLPFSNFNHSKLHINSFRFKCPSWFSSNVKDVLHRLLEPDPNRRMTMQELKECDWFKNGTPPHLKECNILNIDDSEMEMQNQGAAFDDEDQLQLREKQPNPAMLNAFELISMCPGLNLSGLFQEGKELKHQGSRFTSKFSASDIISRLEEISKSLGLKMKRTQCRIQMQGSKIAIVAQVFQVAPSLLLVELSKVGGDELEYEKFYHQKLRSTLGEVVWAWTNF